MQKFVVKENNITINFRSKFWKDKLKLIEIEFMQKLDYWIIKCGKQVKNSNELWIYNTQKEWAKQIYCSVSTIKRTIRSLEKEKIIFSKKVEANRGNQTKWYTINYKKITQEKQEVNNISNRNKWKIPLFQKETINYYKHNNNTYNNNARNNKEQKSKEKPK